MACVVGLALFSGVVLKWNSSKPDHPSSDSAVSSPQPPANKVKDDAYSPANTQAQPAASAPSHSLTYSNASSSTDDSTSTVDNPAWNPHASREGNAQLTQGRKQELLDAPMPASGDPLPEHLDKLWPGGTYIARHDKRAPLGVERVSIIQPASLPYPIRIQEYFPDNGEPVIASEVIADRILVGKPANISHDDFVRLLIAAGGALNIRRLTENGVYQVVLAQDYTHPDTIPSSLLFYQSSFASAYAEPDFVQRALLTPNDPGFIDGSLWGPA